MQFTLPGKGSFLTGTFAVKSLLVMKISAVLLLVATFQANAGVSAQTITLSLHDAPLKIVFRAIEEQSDYFFIYRDDWLSGARPVSIRVSGATVEQALAQCFRNQPLTYTLVGNIITLRKKPPSSSGSVVPVPDLPPIRVSGVVTDSASGQPLTGVSVREKNGSHGALTDGKGAFELEVPDDAVLSVSYVGYIPQDVPVAGRRQISIRLGARVSALDQLVVVGYGTQERKDLTGSVSSIGEKDFVKGVATDALQLISGKAAGVDVSQANAEPGGNLNVRIRGVGSINSSNGVLFVIDGLPGGSTANINPSDIKSIEVLKDASAAAIYGTRAANGVVLITTKKGGQGPARVTYNTYWAYQTPSAKLHMLNATGYMHMLNDISSDAGNTPPFTEEQIAAAGRGTDWQDELLRDAWATSQQLSVSGGSDQVKYYTSLRYLSQDGILVSSDVKQYNVLVNLEVTPSDKFRFGFNLNGNLNQKDKIADESNTGNENADPLNAATQFDPTLPPGKNADGAYPVNPSIALDNPLALAYGYDYRNQNNRIYGNVFGEYEVLKGLKATLRLGGDINNIRNDQYTDRTTQRGKASGGIADINSSNAKYWLSEAVLNYDRTFGVHHLTLMGGATWEKFMTLLQGSHATGFLSDVTNTNLLQSGDPLTAQVSSSNIVYTLQSYFARANYTFRDRYLLTATVRRDGTSRFSEKNKYALFPSVALGWRLTEEPFMKNLTALSNLKLRMSYGQMGNEGIGNFATIATYVAGGNTVLGGNKVSGAQPARIPNPDLKWETTEEYNVGIDFGLFRDRVSGSVEYYARNTVDQLFNKPVPMSTGFSNILTNFGKVRNSGFDISVTTQNLAGKFGWSTTLNLSTLKNEVVMLPPYIGEIISGGIVANIPGFAIVKEGYPMYAFYGYKVTGIFQEGDDIAHSAQPDAKPGWPIFQDRDGNGKIDAQDRTILGNPFPSLTYSFGNSFSYGPFSLDIYWLGVSGIKTFNANIVESMFPINFNRNIMSKYYQERWTADRPNTGFPSGVNSAVYFGNGKMINTYSIQSAAYLRLRNVTLSCNLPLRNTRVFKAVSLSLTGENLLTITHFEGYDPAANQTGDGSNVAKSSYNNYPLARTFTLGANVTF
ncbi:TonB-dependent receptor [Compostibacter hankyongensis]|uniref:TonB-dependent receptor n=1 Tax=Compostibacter hankyongensis TaxID=1007089 RepID=A0ABP8FCB0_9BACT